MTWQELYGSREVCETCGHGKALRAPYGGGYIDAGYCSCVHGAEVSTPRWFYVEAHTSRGVIFCGKVQATEAEIRKVFTGCVIASNGTVTVWRAPNDTRDAMRHVNAKAANANVAAIGRRKVYR